MKRYFKNAQLPILCAVFALTLAACAPKSAIVKEEIKSSVAEQKTTPATQATVVVPEEKVTSEKIAPEKITSSELTAGAKKESSAKYASLAPGDELTQKAVEAGKLYTVYFDYNKYTIRDNDKDYLSKDASWLKLNAQVKVKIEGHADERGDAEYNLALGEKRAQTVKKHLEVMGINSSRLSTVSYGKEKPVDNGHNEDAWSKNRRAEFSIEN